MLHDNLLRDRAIRIFTLVAFFVFISLATGDVSARQDAPITRDGLLNALDYGRLHPQHRHDADFFIAQIRESGVDFQLSPSDEQKIRQSGAYLGQDGLNKLITAIREGVKRVKIYLFEYRPCDKYQEQFAEMLRFQIDSIAGKFNVPTLKLVSAGKWEKSLAEANEYWNTTHSLQLLHGSCFGPEDNKKVTMASHVILGSLKGNLDNPLYIESTIDVSEYSKTRDIYSLVLLYSLAMDAKTRGDGRESISNYLQTAYGIAVQCKFKNSTIVDPIKKSIKDMLIQMGEKSVEEPECK